MLKAAKRALLERWNMPYSPVPGFPAALYRRFRNCGPISLVDVGAHIGDFTLAAKRVCDVESAVLIEPIPHLASKLRENPALAGFSVLDCIVADTDGERSFIVNDDFPYISSVLPIDQSSSYLEAFAEGKEDLICRPAKSLDSILSNFSAEVIDILKIDVQGFEEKVLAGADRTLARTRCVWIEVSFRPLYQDSAVFGEVYDRMIESRFSLTEIEPGFRAQDGELLQADLLFERL